MGKCVFNHCNNFFKQKHRAVTSNGTINFSNNKKLNNLGKFKINYVAHFFWMKFGIKYITLSQFILFRGETSGITKLWTSNLRYRIIILVSHWLLHAQTGTGTQRKINHNNRTKRARLVESVARSVRLLWCRMAERAT